VRVLPKRRLVNIRTQGQEANVQSNKKKSKGNSKNTNFRQKSGKSKAKSGKIITIKIKLNLF